IDMLAWAGTMLAFAARPPDPANVGADRWLPMWRERLDALEPFLHTWLAHQQRDDYWRHGSVCEAYGAIDAAVLAVGGWHAPRRGSAGRSARWARTARRPSWSAPRSTPASTPAASSPSATPATCRPTSGRRTADRCASTRYR